uniref:GMC_oxred_C domain-containing protein n=1 Tax=Haemonchus contortus TaxID=6289 RepID=A0A7I4XXV0_HAECO
MMLIILAVLLPVVRLEIDERPENCQALKATTVHPMNLSDPVKEELQKGLNPKNLSDIDGIATYYIGSSDTSDPEKMLQFTAICISGAEDSPRGRSVANPEASFPHDLPHARQVYIGDVHQLAPHVMCPSTSNPAVHGARSVMDLLLRAPAVHVAPHITTFRAHSPLLALPNRNAYKGQLTTEELEQAVLESWDGISGEVFRNVVSSVPCRLFDIGLEQGRHADY